MNIKDRFNEPDEARLIPIGSIKSAERRAVSSFLAVLNIVSGFRHRLLKAIDIKTGSKWNFETYVEISTNENVPSTSSRKYERPDGLIINSWGDNSWCAFIEAKVNNNKLEAEQIFAYLSLAKDKKVKVDTLITISNDFVPTPHQSPIDLGKSSQKLAGKLFHWSWEYIKTEAMLQYEVEADPEQKIILNEFIRFLKHESTGVKEFSQMPKSWTEAIKSRANEMSDEDAKEIINSWHQLLKNLSLKLTRSYHDSVSIDTRKLLNSSNDKSIDKNNILSEMKTFSDDRVMNGEMVYSDKRYPMEIKVDLSGISPSIQSLMRVVAPNDKTFNSQIKWFTSQLNKILDAHVKKANLITNPKEKISKLTLLNDIREATYITAIGLRGYIHQKRLSSVIEDPSCLDPEGKFSSKGPKILAVSIIQQCTNNEVGSKKIIQSVEKVATRFQNTFVHRLQEYKPRAPRSSVNKEQHIHADTMPD